MLYSCIHMATAGVKGLTIGTHGPHTLDFDQTQCIMPHKQVRLSLCMHTFTPRDYRQHLGLRVDCA